MLALSGVSQDLVMWQEYSFCCQWFDRFGLHDGWVALRGLQHRPLVADLVEDVLDQSLLAPALVQGLVSIDLAPVKLFSPPIELFDANGSDIRSILNIKEQPNVYFRTRRCVSHDISSVDATAVPNQA